MTGLPPETQQPVDINYGLFLISSCDGLKSTRCLCSGLSWALITAQSFCLSWPGIQRAVGTTVSLESGLAAKCDLERVYLELESFLLLLLRGERMAQVWSEIS